MLEASRDTLTERPQGMRQRRRIGFVVRQGGFRRDRVRRSTRIDAALVLTACEPGHARADAAIASRQFALSERGELADYGDAVAGKSPVHSSTDTPQHRDRLVGEKDGGLSPAEHREAARLVEIEASLARNLVSLKPDRDGNRRAYLRPAGRAQPGAAPDMRREAFLCRRDRGTPRRSTTARREVSAAASPRRIARPTSLYFAMSGRMHHRIRASGQRLEHRHRRAHTIKPRHIATGEHDAAACLRRRSLGDRQDRDGRVFRPRRKRRRNRHGRSTEREAAAWWTWRGEPHAAQRSRRIDEVARAPQSRHSVVTRPPPDATTTPRPAPRSNRREPGAAGG